LRCYSIIVYLFSSCFQIKNWNDEVLCVPSSLWWLNPTSGTRDCNGLPFHMSRNITKRDGIFQELCNMSFQEVSSSMLNSILEYCQFHVVQGCSNKERKLFDEKFVTIPAERLYELASAANSLKLRSLVELTCRAIARTLERSSPEEICDKFNLPIEKLEPFINITCDPNIVPLNRLKRNKLKERERVLENVGVQEKEEHVVDERPIEELLSFINGSNDAEIKEKKTSKNVIKNRTKKKHQQKNSSLTSSNSLSAWAIYSIDKLILCQSLCNLYFGRVNLFKFWIVSSLFQLCLILWIQCVTIRKQC